MLQWYPENPQQMELVTGYAPHTQSEGREGERKGGRKEERKERKQRRNFYRYIIGESERGGECQRAAGLAHCEHTEKAALPPSVPPSLPRSLS